MKKKSSKDSAIALSPAKVNLFLKVVSKRDDGYHNIISIVDPITLFDRLTFKLLDEDTVIVEDSRSLLPRENTIHKAATIIKERFNVKKGVYVYVEKNIPVGSGLGGPSSNAVSTIKTLIDLWDINVKREELFEIVKKIGADCPLFLYGKSCKIEGIGDIITNVELPKLHYVIVYPNRPLSTKDVYERVKIVLTKKENDIKLSEKFKSCKDVAEILHNDLEMAAIDMFPELINIKDRLMTAGAMGSLMSGSGSSVFGIFKDKDMALKARDKLEDLGSVFTATSF